MTCDARMFIADVYVSVHGLKRLSVYDMKQHVLLLLLLRYSCHNQYVDYSAIFRKYQWAPKIKLGIWVIFRQRVVSQ